MAKILREVDVGEKLWSEACFIQFVGVKEDTAREVIGDNPDVQLIGGRGCWKAPVSAISGHPTRQAISGKTIPVTNAQLLDDHYTPQAPLFRELTCPAALPQLGRIQLHPTAFQRQPRSQLSWEQPRKEERLRIPAAITTTAPQLPTLTAPIVTPTIQPRFTPTQRVEVPLPKPRAAIHNQQ